MSVNSKEIDLIVRASLKGGKTLDDVAKSILDIESALDLQSKAAKRGEGSIDDLKNTLESLKQVQNQLKDQASLVSQFDALGKKIETSSDRVAKATKAHDDYKAKLEQTGGATDKQSERLIRLAGVVERTQSTLAKQRADQEAIAVALREAGIATDQFADAESRLRQSAAQLGLTINSTQESIRTYTDDLRAAKTAEANLADQKTFEAKLDEAARLNKAGEYIRFWSEALQKADVAQEQTRVNTALRKTADEALAAVRGYRTLGTAAKSLQTSSNSLRTVIDGIISPSEQARTTLKGVQDEIARVGTAASTAKGPINDYKGQVASLVAVQKSLSQQASLVDAFSRQSDVLTEAKGDYQSARAQVIQLAESLRTSAGANEQLEASLKQAQVTLTRSRQNLLDQSAAWRDLRAQMRAAGLNTNDIAESQSRLTQAARGSTAALQQLTAAKKKYGEATEQTGTKVNFFATSGRTTLSLLQRMRGEVLSLAASYIGLYGAIEGARKVIDTFNTSQSIRNQLTLVVGNDKDKIEAEYKYIEDVTERLGVSFKDSAIGYVKFAAGAKAAGRAAQETRFIFESFSEAGTVINASGDQMGRVFKALTDIMSKGAIGAEELKQQLGDALPGIFGIAQEALAEKFPSLIKAMSDGKVGVGELVVIAEELRKKMGDVLPKAIQSLHANQERLNNEVFRFKGLVADAGFADAYGKLVVSLTEFFQSSKGQEFAKDISDALTSVVDLLRFMIENIDLTVRAFKFGFGAVASFIGTGLLISLAAIPALLKKIEIAAGSAGIAVTFLGKAFLWGQLIWTAWNLGQLLYEQVPFVQKWSQTIIGYVDGLATWTVAKFKLLKNSINEFFLSSIGSAAGFLADVAKWVGADNYEKIFRKASEPIKGELAKVRAESKALETQLEKDLLSIGKLIDDIQTTADGTAKPSAAKPKPPRTEAPVGVSGPVKIDEASAKKRLSIKEQLESELNNIEAKIERNEKDNLKSRIDAITLGYANLLTKIRKFGGAEGAAMETRLQSMIGELEAQEVRKFNDKLIEEEKRLAGQLDQVDQTIGRNAKTSLDARLNLLQVEFDKRSAAVAAYRAKLQENNLSTQPADDLQSRNTAQFNELKIIEQSKFYEDSINALIDERKRRLEEIATLRSVGILNEFTEETKATEVVNELQPKIKELADEAMRFAEVMRDLLPADSPLLATLDALILKSRVGAAGVKGLKVDFATTLEQGAIQAGKSGLSTFFNDLTSGAKTFGDALKDLVRGFAQAMARMAADALAADIMKKLMGSASASGGSSGGWLQAAGTWFAGLFHSGGVVGASGGRKRAAPMEWFANAPRYHGGGVIGMSPDEYPAILKKNEEVLTQNDPRNVLNGGASQPASSGYRIVNVIDPSLVDDYMTSSAGEQVILNTIGRNPGYVRQLVGA